METKPKVSEPETSLQALLQEAYIRSTFNQEVVWLKPVCLSKCSCFCLLFGNITMPPDLPVSVGHEHDVELSCTANTCPTLFGFCNHCQKDGPHRQYNPDSRPQQSDWNLNIQCLPPFKAVWQASNIINTLCGLLQASNDEKGCEKEWFSYLWIYNKYCNKLPLNVPHSYLGQHPASFNCCSLAN